MRHGFLAVMAAKLALIFSFPPGAEPGACPAGTVSVDVTTTSELQTLMTAINCTGEGVFNVTWIGSVPLVETIQVCEEKQITVTGSTSGIANVSSAVVDAGSTTGIFKVCNGSTLSLNGLVLEGGFSTNGGAVDARWSSSVNVTDCVFTSNSATTGGAIYAESSEIYIRGDTVFADNSAGENGGAVSLYSNAVVNVDGNTSFFRNSAGGDGGAIFVSTNSAINLNGSTFFVDNSAQDDGGAVSVESFASIQVEGTCSFDSSVAGDNGGAVYVGTDSSIAVQGNTRFSDNKAGGHGGAVSVARVSFFRMEGATYFDDNSSKEQGGAIYSGLDASLLIDGLTSFHGNTAEDEGGAVFVYEGGLMDVYGDTYFVENKAGNSAGAIYLAFDSSAHIEGITFFDSNKAEDHGGAVYVYWESSMSFDGNSSFVNNQAGKNAGGIYVESNSSIHTDGLAQFHSNTATDHGGAIYSSSNCSVEIVGSNSMFNNKAEDNGGAIYLFDSKLLINGNTSMTYNSANWPGGGALYASQSEVKIDGSAHIAYNNAYDGGAILSHEADISITGNASFAYNSADRDGGAIKMIDSTAAIIGGGVELSSANALTEGVHAAAIISFIGNTAFIDGGAILFTYPADTFIRGVKFASNEAMFGGAVSLVSTAESSVDFELCEFESNNATRGGALHLTGEGQSFIRDSSFYQNVAAQTGGALFNTGPLEAHGTDFAENVAGDDGLAIHNGDTDELVLLDVTFSDNLLRCPPEEYNTDDTSSSSCRFEMVCAQCMDGCDSDLANVTIGGDKPPVCEAIPEGVQPSSSVTTIETFIIKEGYYRVSSSSSIVLECYQKDACVGGLDASNYCETGYMGPYCAVCTEGFAPGTNSRCHKCSGDNRGLTAGLAITFLIVVLLVALLVASYLLAVEDGGEETGSEARCSWRRKLSAFHNAFVKTVPLSADSIVVVVLQIIIQFSDIAGSVYPQEYEEFLSKLAIVNVDIGFMLSNACILSTNFYDRLIFATISPLVILLACACTFIIASNRIRTRNVSTAEAILKRKHLSVVLFVIFFVYSFVSFTVLQTFVCDPLDDGKAYLRADYSITCHTATYTAYKTYASFMVCVYPIGVPAFFGWWLVRNRRDLEKPGRQSVSGLQSYRFLWAAYRPACYYYEVVECARRIVLTGVAVFVLPDTAEQVAIVLLLAVMFMFISESLSPFESKLDMWLYRWGNGIILASMYVALLLKVDLAVEGTRSSSAITALLIGANAFMFLTVVVQAALLVRAVYAPRILKERAAVAGWSQRWIVRAAALEEEGLDGGELELHSFSSQRGRTSKMAWMREPEGSHL